MDRPNLIFLSLHPPSLSLPQAGQKLVHQRLHELAKINEIHLVFFYNRRDRDFINLEDFNFCKTVFSIEMSLWTKIKYSLGSFSRPLPVALRFDTRVRRHILNLSLVHSCEVIHIEYEQGIEYLKDFKQKELKSTLVLHDVISQSLGRFRDLAPRFSLKKLLYSLQFSRMQRWEEKSLALATEIVVLNKKDSNFIKENFGNYLIDTSISIDYPKVSSRFSEASRTSRSANTLLFWGAMDRVENEDAVLWFVEKIFPGILKLVPHVNLMVVGSNPSARVKNLSCANILVTGFVDDPIPYFEKATLSVAPLRYGAGIKLKVLEALAAGLRVVGTSVAAEGVDFSDEQIIVADTEANFIASVIRALRIENP